MILALLVPALAMAAQLTLLCETGKGTAPARIVLKAGGGHTLFACGHIEKKGGYTELTAFKVFAINKAGKRQAGHILQGADLPIYRVVTKADTLALQELIWSGKEKIAAFEQLISCDEKTCKAAPASCIFEAPKKVDSKALAKVRAFMTGSKKGKLPDEKLIHALAGLAYAGDKDAQAIFHDRGPLRIDGSAAEAYFDHRAMLSRLRKAGCFAVPAKPVPGAPEKG